MQTFFLTVGPAQRNLTHPFGRALADAHPAARSFPSVTPQSSPGCHLPGPLLGKVGRNYKAPVSRLGLFLLLTAPTPCPHMHCGGPQNCLAHGLAAFLGCAMLCSQVSPGTGGSRKAAAVWERAEETPGTKASSGSKKPGLGPSRAATTPEGRCREVGKGSWGRGWVGWIWSHSTSWGGCCADWKPVSGIPGGGSQPLRHMATGHQAYP